MGGNFNMDLKQMGWEGMAGIGLAEVRNKWRAAVNTEWGFGFYRMQGIWQAEELWFFERDSAACS